MGVENPRFSITRVSGHALENVMNRWSLNLLEATNFIEERLQIASEPVKTRARKKKYQGRYILRPGDAVFIAEKAEEGFEIVTVMRGGYITRMMREGKLLRRKSR